VERTANYSLIFSVQIGREGERSSGEALSVAAGPCHRFLFQKRVRIFTP